MASESRAFGEGDGPTGDAPPPGDAGSGRKPTPRAFWGLLAAGVVLQVVLCVRMLALWSGMGFRPSPSYVLTNLLLAGAGLLAGFQPVRSGVLWQRVVGYTVCAYPVYVFAEHLAWAFNLTALRD